MIILNLFIGVIMKGMEEMEDEMAQNDGKKSQDEYQQEILNRLKAIETKLN